MDQLAGQRALVALGGLEAEPAELAHPDPLQDPRDRRARHVEQVSELRGGEPQPPQSGQQLHRALVGTVRDQSRRRGAIGQARQPLSPKPLHPLATGALAHFGRLGGPRERPPVINDPAHHPLALSQ
jgi:hypothetical protein